MTPQIFTTFIVEPLLGWMAIGSISLVIYLAVLEVREIRRNRRMDATRRRLGLRHA